MKDERVITVWLAEAEMKLVEHRARQLGLGSVEHYAALVLRESSKGQTRLPTQAAEVTR